MTKRVLCRECVRLGLSKRKQLSSNLQRPRRVIYDGMGTVCVRLCALLYPLCTRSIKGENYKETGDSQKSLWRAEVTTTQRGALMNPKSSCIEREERDVSEQSRNSVQCDPISTSRPRESSLDDS